MGVVGRVDRECKLRLSLVLVSEALEQDRRETGASTSTDRVEDCEALHGVATLGHSPDPVKRILNEITVVA